MKKSVLALLVVGLVSLTGCDTIPGVVSETTPPTVESSATDPTPVSSDSTPVTPVTSDSTPVSVDTEPGGETSSSTDGGDEGGDKPSGPTTGTIDQIWLNLQIMGINGNYTVNTLFQDETTEDYFAVDKGYAWLNTEDQGYALATSWEGGDKKVAYTVTKAETGDTYQLGGPVYTQNPVTGAVEDLTDLNDINYLHEIGDTSLVATDYLEQTEDGKVITKNQDLIDDLLWASAAYEAAPTAQDAALFTQAEFGFTEAGDLTVTFTPDTSTSGQIYWTSAYLDPTKPTILTFKDIEGTQVSGIEAAVANFSLPAALNTTSNPVFIDDESATLSFTVEQHLIPAYGEYGYSIPVVSGTTSWSDSAISIMSESDTETVDYYVSKTDQGGAELLQVDPVDGQVVSSPQNYGFNYYLDVFTPKNSFDPNLFRASGETGEYISYSAAATDALVTACTGYTFAYPFVNATLTAGLESTVIEASTGYLGYTQVGYGIYLVENVCTITVTSVKDGELTKPTQLNTNSSFDSQYISGKLDGTANPIKVHESVEDLDGIYVFTYTDTFYDGSNIVSLDYKPTAIDQSTGEVTYAISDGTIFHYDATDSIDYYILTPNQNGKLSAYHYTLGDQNVDSTGDNTWAQFFKDYFFPYNTGAFQKVEDEEGAAAGIDDNEEQTAQAETYTFIPHLIGQSPYYLVNLSPVNISNCLDLLNSSFLLETDGTHITSIGFQGTTFGSMYELVYIYDELQFTYGDDVKSDSGYTAAIAALNAALSSTGGSGEGAGA